MAWRIVKQPNGLYARFADPVDNFTHLNMTEEEAYFVCMDHQCSTLDAEAKIIRADADTTWGGRTGRWEEALRTIRVIHGEAEVEKVKAMIAIPQE